MNLNHRLDERIQLYRAVVITQQGTTIKTKKRKFIYSYNQYMEGGLYCNARNMKNTEIVSMGLQQQKEYLQFEVNRNPKIKEDLKVIYRGEIYDITPPIDNLDGRTPHITFMAVKTTDTTTYEGDLYE